MISCPLWKSKQDRTIGNTFIQILNDTAHWGMQSYTDKAVNSITGTLGNLMQEPQDTPSLWFLIFAKAKVWQTVLKPMPIPKRHWRSQNHYTGLDNEQDRLEVGPGRAHLGRCWTHQWKTLHLPEGFSRKKLSYSQRSERVSKGRGEEERSGEEGAAREPGPWGLWLGPGSHALWGLHLYPYNKAHGGQG